jgi:alkyldihydroxyacetonephosphate synthase
MVEAEWILFLSICQELGGIDLGEKPGNHWWKHRYSIAYRMSEILYQRGTFLDTIEVATTWEHLEDLYMKMKEEISEICFVMGHFSHFYPQGGAIYFTFVGQGGDREEDLYQDVWNRAMETCLMQGGTISHHHGIGILKGPWLKRELGELMEVFLTLKKALDPNNILNPGKMGL